MSVLKIENVSFAYEKKMVLKDLNYEFDKGNIYSIVGKSGAGKTTLLSVLSGLAKPTDGVILFDGKDISSMNKYDYRSQCVGVVFQSYNLLTKLTALENVMLSMDISSKKIDNKKERAYELLEQVGLGKEEADRRVLKLSGGQQQRVAIARALSYNPDIILADEPTGNLDSETEDEILDILRGLANQGKCVIIVTHSKEVAEFSDYVYELKSEIKPHKKKKTQ